MQPHLITYIRTSPLSLFMCRSVAVSHGRNRICRYVQRYAQFGGGVIVSAHASPEVELAMHQYFDADAHETRDYRLVKIEASANGVPAGVGGTVLEA